MSCKGILRRVAHGVSACLQVLGNVFYLRKPACHLSIRSDSQSRSNLVTALGGINAIKTVTETFSQATPSVSNGSGLPGCSPGLEPDRMVQSGSLPGKEGYPPGLGTG